MARSKKREFVWLECKECGERNYRTEVNVQGGTPKFELNKFCKKERKRTPHKIRRK
ncbi:MAG: 50S ribosomal protein L33 [Planctomycetes bacterium]|nr:50S ribosomal protein L33 [Planctomycetota bacterium]